MDVTDAALAVSSALSNWNFWALVVVAIGNLTLLISVLNVSTKLSERPWLKRVLVGSTAFIILAAAAGAATGLEGFITLVLVGMAIKCIAVDVWHYWLLYKRGRSGGVE